MKRELGIARCGLACSLCSENTTCAGCMSDSCRDRSWCENRRCAIERGTDTCYRCDETACRKGMLTKSKPLGFTLFTRRYGTDALLDCLEQNERNGVVYHRTGVLGDYDDIPDQAELLAFIRTGKR